MPDVLGDGHPVGHCPRCGAQLQDPSLDYEYDASGTPHVVAKMYDYWCAACGWNADA